MFTSRNPYRQERVEVLTTEQKDKITELYSAGLLENSMRHYFVTEAPAELKFEGGKKFDHLIKKSINKLKAVGNDTLLVMMKEKPGTLSGLKKIIYEKHSDCTKECLEKVVDAIVATTGTWTEYKATFN